MTPKEKAEELITIFMNIKNALYIVAKRKVIINVAKQNALKAVDQLIHETGAKYWYDVKYEIEKL